MNRLQSAQFIVIGIHTKTKEQPRVTSIDNFEVAKLRHNQVKSQVQCSHSLDGSNDLIRGVDGTIKKIR